MTETTYSSHLIEHQLLPALEMLPSFDFTPDNLPEIQTNSGKLFEGIELPLKPIKNSIYGPDGMLDIYLFDPGPWGK
jgi:hypothetical protein